MADFPIKISFFGITESEEPTKGTTDKMLYRRGKETIPNSDGNPDNGKHMLAHLLSNGITPRRCERCTLSSDKITISRSRQQF